jgi:branched-chain amino acid transport system substrate-binding protein
MKKNKNKIYLAIGIVAVVFIAAIIMFSNQGKEETIKIGAIYPLTGNFANYGIEYQRGLQMAAEEINSQGGINGKQIELIFEDDQGNTEKSVTAANKLININKVKYLFTAFSSVSQATAPISQDNNVLYISATVSKIGETGEYIFRDFWDIEDQGSAIGIAINKENVSKIGILAMNYGDTELFLDSVKEEVSDTVFVEERFNFGDTDFKSQLTKIKNANVDAILVYAFPGAESIKITQQIKELKLDNKRLFAGATTYGLPFMYEQFSDTLIKMKVIDSWYSLDSDNTKSTEFSNKYKERYGQELVGDAAYPYDDLYALKIAMEKALTTTDNLKVANEMRNIDMNGVAGRLTFDEKGNSERKAYLQIYTSEGWEKYE